MGWRTLPDMYDALLNVRQSGLDRRQAGAVVGVMLLGAVAG